MVQKQKDDYRKKNTQAQNEGKLQTARQNEHNSYENLE